VRGLRQMFSQVLLASWQRKAVMALALATPITDFQRQHRLNVETSRRGGLRAAN